MVEVGKVYKHYKKGDKYLVLNIAKHSETKQDLVVYQALYGDNQIWVRPLHMWEDVLHIGIQTYYGQNTRFELVEKE